MKRISYADSLISTDDRVADLVLEYAKVLAGTNTADTITIPYRTESGAVAEITMLIGPASQVTASTDDDEEFDADVRPAVAELERRIRHGTPGTMQPDTDPEDGFDDFEDFDEPSSG